MKIYLTVQKSGGGAEEGGIIVKCINLGANMKLDYWYDCLQKDNMKEIIKHAINKIKNYIVSAYHRIY